MNSPHPSKNPFIDIYPPLTAKCQGILSIPHSGEMMPAEFLPYLSGDVEAYKEDVDYKVNDLIDIAALNDIGIAVMVAKIHRVAVDLNRNKEKAVLHWEVNTKGKPIRIQLPEPAQIAKYTTDYYSPYFEILKSILQDLESSFPNPEVRIPVIDLHSMPSRPTDYHLKINPTQKLQRPDFCVSDLWWKYCHPEYIQFIVEQFAARSFAPTINDPYFGGYVTEFVHEFRTNVVQIEINRHLYMDEIKKELLKEKATLLKNKLTQVLVETFKAFAPAQFIQS